MGDMMNITKKILNEYADDESIKATLKLRWFCTDRVELIVSITGSSIDLYVNDRIISAENKHIELIEETDTMLKLKLHNKYELTLEKF